MGYSAEHTARTRARILEAAGRLFRRHGFQDACIEDIMADAGLTRGGFYAHFRSKEDLFVNVLAEELEFTMRLRQARDRANGSPRQEALARVRYYLAPDNLRRVGAACTMAANISDIGRTSVAARRAFAASFAALEKEFCEIVARRRCEDRSERALAAIAACVGAIALARAVADSAKSAQILRASEKAVMRELGFRVADADLEGR